MAKKQENQLSYLQMPYPESRSAYRMTKRSWCGLNYKQTVDSGALSMESNISSSEAPYLTPSCCRLPYRSGYANPIGLFGFDNFLLVVYRSGSAILIDYITEKNGSAQVYTGTIKASGATVKDEFPRCIVQFNVYDTPTDPVSGQYVKKLLIFPDKKSMDFTVTQSGFQVKDMSVLVKEYTNDVESEDGTYPPPESASHNYFYQNLYNQQIYRWVDDESNKDNSGWKVTAAVPAMPDIRYAAVHLSRLFGVSGDRVYASGYNDYTNWNLDTVEEYNESNAWCSAAQSNTKADGEFTGITNYQGHVVCFKRDFMHEIYNTKNPFRIQDVYAEGTIDNRTVQDVDGKLIFVSDDNVKIYTGSNPRVISYYLNLKRYVGAVSGTDGQRYYLYCEDENSDRHLFVYDTATEYWSEQEITYRVLNFAHNRNGMYALCGNGVVYKLDTENYNHSWSFETDLITNATVDIKHVKKIQMLMEIAFGASVKVYALYDDEKFNQSTSHLVYSDNGKRRKTMRVKLRKTAHYGVKLHVEGYGYVKLYELELLVEAGGESYA